MPKLMYSEAGGFHNFPDGEQPAGWVDGEPIRQVLLSAKALLDAKSITVTLSEVPAAPAAQPHPQDTPKRRPGRPPKTIAVENDHRYIPNPD